MNWNKEKLIVQNGEIVEAQAPVIISASRSTDIPAFYSDWLVERLKAGYVKWMNPFNRKDMYVSFSNARLIVFWSKDPKPIIKYLDFINEKIPNYYFQFTLNDYDKEKIEPNVPSVSSRIETFSQLSEKIGKDKVIWRFDPLLLSDKIGVDDLLRKVEKIGNQLKGMTSKLVFSFADILIYRMVQSNLRKGSSNYHEFSENSMDEFAKGLHTLNKNWNFEIGTCAEKIPLEKYDILHNKCIDDDLIFKLFPHDKILMNFLGVKISPPDIFSHNQIVEKQKKMKDNGQRKYCGCIFSKDIGQYNTCPHLCEYCYANGSKELALKNWKEHLQDKFSESITGK